MVSTIRLGDVPGDPEDGAISQLMFSSISEWPSFPLGDEISAPEVPLSFLGEIYDNPIPTTSVKGYFGQVERHRWNTLNIEQPPTIGDGDSTPTPQNPCSRRRRTADEIPTDLITLEAYNGTENYAIPGQLYLEYQETISRPNDFAITPPAPQTLLAEGKLSLLEPLGSRSAAKSYL